LGLHCGIDWATDHHDVSVIDDDGRVVARGRVTNDAAGFAALLRLLANAGDTAKHPIPVGIETDRGLLVAALRETGRVIYPINPLAELPSTSRVTSARVGTDSSAMNGTSSRSTSHRRPSTSSAGHNSSAKSRSRSAISRMARSDSAAVHPPVGGI
jgi:Transposase